MVFERHIVWPDGRREIEGATPKQLPAPSHVSVENNDQSICVEKPSPKFRKRRSIKSGVCGY
jgi:hypothetical protein